MVRNRNQKLRPNSDTTDTKPNLLQPQHCPNLQPSDRVYERPAEVGLVEHPKVATVRAADARVLDMVAFSQKARWQ